jgi:ADP-ribosylation factor-like protein 1
MMEHELWDAPLLVLANKQDEPGAVSTREIAEHLQLFSLSNRNWYIIDTRATHPDLSEANLYAGLDWLVEVLLMPAAKRQQKAKHDNKARRQQALK